MSEDSKERGKSSISLILPIIVFYVVLMAVIVLFSVVLFKYGLVSFKTKSIADLKQSESVSEVVVDDEADEVRIEDSDVNNDESNITDTNVAESISDESIAESASTETTKEESSPGEIASSISYSANTDLSGSTSLSPERIAYISNLSLTGSGYEGIKGTGKYNYGEALQKSILFYELQRSGKLPDNTRTNWRGDSCLKDGADNGLDLTGGLFDAGDHVKFNLPMAYTCAMLSWSMVEDPDAYADSKQKEYALNNIRYICDYFIKCHPEDEVYYYQVGDGGQDHSWWGPAECLEARMDRPSYKVTASNPGSCVTGETAAAMAAASIVFEKEDPKYSKLLLSHAKSLYAFADKYKSDSGYTAANGYYTSWSGFNDELAFAGAWLYKATKDKDYLKKAEDYYSKTGQNEKWALCWDDVTVGAALLLSDITGDSKYTGFIEKHLDYWTTGNNGQKIQYSPKGLAWVDNWGSLRYATTTGFIAAVYSESKNCPKNKKDTYWNFAVSQADYALGSSGRSYVCGFGENPPVHPHHRTAQGSYANDMNTPQQARHILVGALVGGPDAGDNYNDEVSDYNKNEVACDYNAGFTGLLAKLYTRYHGETLKNFGAVETPENEIFCEAGINVNGNDFVEIKAFVYNESAWPARVSKDLEMRYYVDLSEVYDAGGSASDIEVTTNYIQNASCNGLTAYDEDKHIYYVSISFDDGALYPGGQDSFKKEVQFRIRSINGVWDNSNDYSFEGLPNNSVTTGDRIAIYEGGKLIYGSEP
jgi:endoglucanase